MHVINTTDPSPDPATDTTDARLICIGLDDRGLELAIVALEREDAIS